MRWFSRPQDSPCKTSRTCMRYSRIDNGKGAERKLPANPRPHPAAPMPDILPETRLTRVESSGERHDSGQREIEQPATAQHGQSDAAGAHEVITSPARREVTAELAGKRREASESLPPRHRRAPLQAREARTARGSREVPGQLGAPALSSAMPRKVPRLLRNNLVRNPLRTSHPPVPAVAFRDGRLAGFGHGHNLRAAAR